MYSGMQLKIYLAKYKSVILKLIFTCALYKLEQVEHILQHGDQIYKQCDNLKEYGDYNIEEFKNELIFSNKTFEEEQNEL